MARAGGGDPGDKYPNLFMISVSPSRGHTVEEAQAAVRAELERLKTEDVTDEELAAVKTRARASLIRSLGGGGGRGPGGGNANQNIANRLAEYQAMYGDWRELFRSVDRLDKVTKADIRRVAATTFVDTNRTVGILETETARPTKGQE